MPQKRYLIATLFIAGMLLLVAVVQAFKPPREGGVAPDSAVLSLNLDSFEAIADLRLEDGWAPRFTAAQDPDQWESWPPEGGFGTAWEPASPFLSDQAVALNGPAGRSEVALWHGLEWRHYRFDAPLASARMDPGKHNRLLVTLSLGRGHFQTRLLEVPEGRVLWAVESGPWSRFSWDGKAVLLGLPDPSQAPRLLLTSLPVEGDWPDSSLAPWNEDGLPGAPRGLAVRLEQLWDDGKDLPGPKLLLPWHLGSQVWMPRRDRLWVSTESVWTLWRLRDGVWRRDASGPGILSAQPPRWMGLVTPSPDGAVRSRSEVGASEWQVVPEDLAPWPAYDAAWLWRKDEAQGALTAWDLRWNEGGSPLPRERQRGSLTGAYRAEWRAASNLRASVRGWLPHGPQVALRELEGVAWVWVGDRILLVHLVGTERLRKLKGAAD
ncbi:MAG: hypothetical protein IPQ13_08625 [Holophagaceae bacterium]|nr:hypothetical protein [Holophagaceae bacterium]